MEYTRTFLDNLEKAGQKFVDAAELREQAEIYAYLNYNYPPVYDLAVQYYQHLEDKAWLEYLLSGL